MGLNAISAMSGSMSVNGGVDAEHLRIMRQLEALGITPTGNKSSDKMKLEQALKVKHSQEAGISQQKPNQQSQVADKNVKEKSEASENMTGASQIAELNKLIYLKRAV